MGWITYAQDFEHLLCNPEKITTQLLPYVANVYGVFLCKGLKMDRGVASYGISNTMGGELRDGVKPFTALQHVSHSSQMLVLTDINPQAKPCFWPLALNKEQWQWRTWSWPPSQSLQGMTDRHRHGCNMSFADGHGAYTRWTDSRTLDLIKGEIAYPKDASDKNADLDRMITMLTHTE
jgi:prepilin-type processing-associated H-X9-DG protein